MLCDQGNSGRSVGIGNHGSRSLGSCTPVEWSGPSSLAPYHVLLVFLLRPGCNCFFLAELVHRVHGVRRRSAKELITRRYGLGRMRFYAL